MEPHTYRPAAPTPAGIGRGGGSDTRGRSAQPTGDDPPRGDGTTVSTCSHRQYRRRLKPVLSNRLPGRCFEMPVEVFGRASGAVMGTARDAFSVRGGRRRPPRTGPPHHCQQLSFALTVHCVI
jgi:hypothetical protein